MVQGWGQPSVKLGQLTPVSLEVSAADSITKQLEDEHGGLLLNPKIQGYVRMVGSRLAKHSSRPDFPKQFKVLADDKVVNAFALGNGNTYVTMGLLKMLDDEAELAEIMGHEIGHVDHRHMAHKMDLMFGVQGLTAVVQAFGGKKVAAQQELVDQASGLASGLLINGFGRDQELDADATGLSYAVKAGYDPMGSVRVFKKFQALEKGDGGGFLESFFRSHPTANVRVDQLEAVIRSQFGNTGGETYRDRYQEIVKGIPAPKGGDALPVVAGGVALATAVGLAIYFSA